jgi:hypothetical protein
MKSIDLGKIAGLRVSAFPNALIGFIGLWIVLSILAIVPPLLPPVHAIIGALICTLLHVFSEFWHQLGHSWAAGRTGYPMSGVRFWWILGQSMYPKDEPALPGSIHIRRALGGPIASFLLALFSAVAFLAIGNLIGETNEPNTLIWWWVSFFLILDNLFFFTIGAFLPLGFTDGSTILRWWGK